MSDEVESTIKMMENYHKKGGDYIIPVEVVNDIKNLIIELEKEKNNIFNTGIRECLRIRDMKDKEIERLNNIINGMEKFFQYAYDNEVRPLNDRKVSVWTICLDKLQELKGSDKE